MRFFSFALLILALSFGPLFLYFEFVLKEQINKSNYISCKKSLEQSAQQIRNLILAQKVQAEKWFHDEGGNSESISNQWVDVAVFEFVEDRWILRQHQLNNSFTSLYNISKSDILKSYSKTSWPNPGIKKVLFSKSRLNYMEMLTVNVPIQKMTKDELKSYFVRINLLPTELFSFMNSENNCIKNIINSKGNLLFSQEGFLKKKQFLSNLQSHKSASVDNTKTLKVQLDEDEFDTYLYNKIFRDFILVSELKQNELIAIATATKLVRINGLLLVIFIIFITMYWAKVYRSQMRYIMNTIHNMSLGVFRSQSRNLDGEFGKIQGSLNKFSNNFINRRRAHSKHQKLMNLKDSSIIQTFEDKQGNIYNVTVLHLELNNTDVVLSDFELQSSAKDFSLLWERVHDIVSENQGIVDTISGGTLRAIWLETSNNPNTINVATEVAFQIQSLIVNLNRKRFDEDKSPYRIYSALHYGTVLLGLFGPKERKEFTPVGPVLRETQDLARVARITGNSIVSSSNIYEKMHRKFLFKELKQDLIEQRIFHIHLRSERATEDMNRPERRDPRRRKSPEVSYEKKTRKKKVTKTKKKKK